MPADKRDVHGIRARRHLRQRIELGKLLVRQEMIYLDEIAMDVGQDRRGAADGDKPQHQEMQEKRAEVCAAHYAFSFHAAARAKGARAPKTHKSGQRKTPTPTNASTPNDHGSTRRGNTDANLT